MESSKQLSFDAIKTNSVHTRTNLVTIRNMARPYDELSEDWPHAPHEQEHFQQLVDEIVKTRAAGKPVIWSMGAHVIKNGLSRYIIEMVRHGILTHVSGNGATSIHDFELALLGETSEDVARSIEDGSFGMWEETGRYMNEAIQQGSSSGIGYGESLFRYLDQHPERFPHYDDCVFVQCQRSGIPYTCHISIGTDIIHQHPIVDFEALGRTSGKDFEKMTQSIAEMKDGGVFLNFGSAISGPEIFLKALSICRNQGLKMSPIVAANFDIVPVFENPVPPVTDPEYYYRPRRNFIERLTQVGGQGYLFHGLHQITIPQLFEQVLRKKQELGIDFPPYVHKENLSQEQVNLFPVASRSASFSVEHLVSDKSKPKMDWPKAVDSDFCNFVIRIKEARKNGHEVLVNLGGNVIGSGVSLEICDLIEQGFITHLALNGAGAFQDLELAAFGQTEERDDHSLKDGKLGMWREPGELLHTALREGYATGLGYGQSLMNHMEANPDLYTYRRYSLIHACSQKGIPCTVHVTLGTDAIQQHPDVDFAIQGGASGRDFKIYANTVTRLDGGVFINFGSSVTGPEVFLKALSIARNLGFAVHRITTANFDIVQLGDYHRKVSYGDWDYYYRPRKNIVHRPTSLGGEGFHFEGLHQQTIPALSNILLNTMEEGSREE
ncbi:hypothetical protein [Paenibacillus pectinilyticus]|uniref:hypothetical protein n=1 Tax=Paenibacillus pectinilyticus TaxID=512399 RepID=UPI000AD20AE2|nr:hypothetical protein [Paenibacillus pectinilyticus]